MRKKNIYHFIVSSPCVLDSQEQDLVKQFLENQFEHVTILYSYKTDPTLLAGIRIENGSFLWESSIRKRLMNLKSSLRG